MNNCSFEAALRQYIQTKFNLNFDDTRALFSFVQNVDSSQKHDIWKNVGKQIKLDKQKAHDFFHNSWCLQFYDDFKEHKAEIKEIAADIVKVSKEKANLELLTKEKIVTQTIKEFASRYQTKSFN